MKSLCSRCVNAVVLAKGEGSLSIVIILFGIGVTYIFHGRERGRGRSKLGVENTECCRVKHSVCGKMRKSEFSFLFVLQGASYDVSHACATVFNTGSVHVEK